MNPLFYFCKKGNLFMVKLLLHFTNVNVVHKGYPLILHAYIHQKMEIVKYLLEHGADINTSETSVINGENLMFKAIENNDVEFVKFLIENGFDLEQHRFVQSYLELAIDSEIFFILLNQSVYIRDYSVFLKHRNYKEFVTAFLENGYINKRESYGCSLLREVCKHSREMLGLILNHKDFNPKDSGIDLMRLYEYSQFDIIKELVAKGVFEIESLYRSIEDYNIDFFNFLMQSDIDVNEVKDRDNKTALMYACEKEYYYMVDALLVKGADPNIQDKMGNTAIMYAVRNKRIVEMLKSCNADLDILNAYGKNFFDIREEVKK